MTSSLVGMVGSARVNELRERTGRHLKDRYLERNLSLMVAEVARRLDVTAETVVEFSALDAKRRGIRSETWFDLVKLLDAFGLAVRIGESGRQLGRQAPRRLLEPTTVRVENRVRWNQALRMVNA